MIDATLRRLAEAELAAIVGGDTYPTGPIAPAVLLGRAVAWLLDITPSPSNYYYCKTGLPS